jgi:hypothetical protein
VSLAVAVGADFDAVDDLAAAGVPACDATGADAAAGAAVVLAAFWTPPWPLHAPRPVAVEVVPSLQVVGALESESAARVGSARLSAIKGTASNPTSFIFFMISLPGCFGRTHEL